MTPRSRRHILFFAGAVFLISGLLLARPRLQHEVMLRTALGEPSVSAELIEELIVRDRQPLRVIERFFRTGKIPHRLAALRAISRHVQFLPPGALPAWLRDAALDVDFQVREQALGVLSTTRPPGAAPLILDALRNVDPELQHIAIRAAVAVGATNLITDIAALLAHDHLNVRIAAATALRQWTGQDFGVRRATLGGAYNELGSTQPDVDPVALARVESGLAQWRRWWEENAAQWSQLAPVPGIASRESLRPAPAFALTDLAGQTVRLEDLRGRPVFLNFWATWCTACWSELPELVKLQERHGEHITILGIALDGLPDQHELDHGHPESAHHEGEGHDHAAPAAAGATRATSREALVKWVGGFARSKGLNYRILLDPEGASSLVYQGNELPVNVLIDARGQLRRRFIGPRPAAAFDAMLAELAVSTTGTDPP